MIETESGTLYTGITNDLWKRFRKHLTGRGGKFFRTSRPKQILYCETCLTKGLALSRESQIKSLSREEKMKLL